MAVFFMSPKKLSAMGACLCRAARCLYKLYIVASGDELQPFTMSFYRFTAGKFLEWIEGQGMTVNAIYKRVELLGRRIGIEGLFPHDLRHTWAERAKKNPAKLLQAAGGWNSEAMPLRCYQRSS